MSAPRTIDCEYLFPNLAAAYLLTEGSEAAFVETNTAHAVPRLLQALEAAGRRPEDVRWIIVTHVHLDHAGGASALMEKCPNAMLLAHPRAAPHLIDPSRLVSSARKVYGDEPFRKMYGEIRPIPEARVRTMADEETLTWGARTLRFLHTRGHANHHFCVHDSASNGVFTGDAFGLRYPALQQRGLFIFPSTSPTDFDPGEARQSVRRIAAAGERAYLTHFGEVDAVAQAAEQLIAFLDFSEELLSEVSRRYDNTAAMTEHCERELWRHVGGLFEKRGQPLDAPARELLGLDIGLNAQGIAHVAMKLRSPRKDAPH